MTSPIASMEIRTENDVVAARQLARRAATLLGFDRQGETRVATAVSEIARNAFQYAGSGRMELSVRLDGGALLEVRVIDTGAGIADIEEILAGRYRSPSGMGLGIVGARRLMDQFHVDTSPKGTLVTLAKRLPRGVQAPGPADLSRIAAELARPAPGDVLQELQVQNQELLRTLSELRAQRAQLEHVNRELEETNRGVVALYAELDEKAVSLQRVNELKTRFLSDMTHEFRTPLNSIISLARLLLQRVDGDLAPEQEKQVRFIEKSASDLSELVNDLLDLAKVEAGKVTVRPGEIEVEELFGTLRGMLRPLLSLNTSVNLSFEAAPGLPVLRTDESKVSQILRNFISNALKYTERGEVRVSARPEAEGNVLFSVADTGIGIAQEDQERIFEEFVQLDSSMQRRVRGTGLGLPLARKLAALLGGSIGVRSAPGKGSTFWALIPADYRGPETVSLFPEVTRALDPARSPLLVVEDNRETLFVYESYFKDTRFQVVPARTLKDAREWLRTIRPAAMLLDILLEGESSWSFLAEVRNDERTRDLPVVVLTMVGNERRALALGADAFHEKPVERDWLLATLERLTSADRSDRALIIDDDEVSRYILRSLLAETRLGILEAAGGREGLARARAAKPRVIFLDLRMPDMDGFETLDALTRDPETRSIPVIINTSMVLSEAERRRLSAAVAILPKESPSREAARARLGAALAAAGMGEGDEAHV